MWRKCTVQGFSCNTLTAGIVGWKFCDNDFYCCIASWFVYLNKQFIGSSVVLSACVYNFVIKKTNIYAVSDKSYQDTQLALQVAQNARNIKNQVKINLVRIHTFNLNVTLNGAPAFERDVSNLIFFIAVFWLW